MRQRVAIDAVAAYYRVALAQVQVATTRDLLGWLDTLAAYNESRVIEGVAAEADLIRSRLERDRVSAESAMQEADLARARAALAAFLSDGALDRAVGSVALRDAPLPLTTFPGTLRPEVRAARERVVASTASVSVERSMLVRQLGATIGLMQSAGMTSMIAGVSLPAPLFDQNRGEQRRASAERDAAAFELAAQERSANAEIRGAAEAARVLTERATKLARNDSAGFLAQADESRRIALGAYREGAVPLFQVIDAARSWADARMTYYQIVFAQHESVLSLIVAEGRDLFTSLPAGLPGDSSR
jgi:cobalt-zinc-cadmium efflux system outer membrane protein